MQQEDLNSLGFHATGMKKPQELPEHLKKEGRIHRRTRSQTTKIATPNAHEKCADGKCECACACVLCDEIESCGRESEVLESFCSRTFTKNAQRKRFYPSSSVTNAVESLSDFLWNETISLALLSDVETLTLRLDLMHQLPTEEYLLSSVAIPITQQSGRQARYAVRLFLESASKEEATIYFSIQCPKYERLELILDLADCVAGTLKYKRLFLLLSAQQSLQALSLADLFQIGSMDSMLSLLRFCVFAFLRFCGRRAEFLSLHVDLSL
uniref:AlNc14C46G3728 protein n=1 Tax=Albugo laibachii Nc14 TaxID=890382 RepID=F0WAK4_9STRA|nr:AlNc14C46G3728 [Albugo laibachii Nc14]|eukprot:CCA18175.1 AlNc14C46G3728 [Albugo laibachii Nc14]